MSTVQWPGMVCMDNHVHHNGDHHLQALVPATHYSHGRQESVLHDGAAMILAWILVMTVIAIAASTECQIVAIMDISATEMVDATAIEA